MGACGSSEAGSDVSPSSFVGTRPSEDMFEVMTMLGIGSFGTVSCCRRKGTSSFVAVKCIKKARLFRRTDHSALVWNERDAMIKCESPFLVTLLCSFHSATELFLTMPFHIGGDLSHRVRVMGPLKPSHVRFFLAEMLCGLEAMHNLHVCHRDIKPDNVLIDAAGHVSLTDLGLAVEYRPDDNRHSSRFWGQCGSYGYRAPEVVRDQCCGPYSDIYSLGVTCFFLLYARVPWPQTQCRLDGQPLIFPIDEVDVDKRITAREIKEHEVYEDVRWDLVQKKNKKSGIGKAPIIPDADCFCFAVANPNSGGSPTKQYKPITAEQQSRFTGFEWVPGDPVTVFGNPFHWSCSPNGSRTGSRLNRAPKATDSPLQSSPHLSSRPGNGSAAVSTRDVQLKNGDLPDTPKSRTDRMLSIVANALDKDLGTSKENGKSREQLASGSPRVTPDRGSKGEKKSIQVSSSPHMSPLRTAQDAPSPRPRLSWGNIHGGSTQSQPENYPSSPGQEGSRLATLAASSKQQKVATLQDSPVVRRAEQAKKEAIMAMYDSGFALSPEMSNHRMKLKRMQNDGKKQSSFLVNTAAQPSKQAVQRLFDKGNTGDKDTAMEVQKRKAAQRLLIQEALPKDPPKLKEEKL